MTIKSLIDKIANAAKSKPNVNYVGVGNVYDLNTLPNVEYSVVYITLSKTSVYQNQINHTVTLFYIDRLTDNLDNKLQVQSDGMKELTNIINTIVWSEDVEVNFPIDFIPFNQRFADDCCGVFATLTFITDSDGDCYFE